MAVSYTHLEIYHSPYEAYPFLSDAGDDLRCDFELFTDQMASRTGLLRAQVKDETLREELLCCLLYTSSGYAISGVYQEHTDCKSALICSVGISYFCFLSAVSNALKNDSFGCMMVPSKSQKIALDKIAPPAL